MSRRSNRGRGASHDYDSNVIAAMPEGPNAKYLKKAKVLPYLETVPNCVFLDANVWASLLVPQKNFDEREVQVQTHSAAMKATATNLWNFLCQREERRIAVMSVDVAQRCFSLFKDTYKMGSEAARRSLAEVLGRVWVSQSPSIELPAVIHPKNQKIVAGALEAGVPHFITFNNALRAVGTVTTECFGTMRTLEIIRPGEYLERFGVPSLPENRVEGELSEID